MTRAHRTAFVLAIGALALCAALEARAEEEKDGEAVDWKTEVQTIWQRNCQKCHTAPDAKFETDRGFLSQLMDTT